MTDRLNLKPKADAMNTRFAAVVALMTGVSAAQASLITADFGVNISQAYNYSTQQYEPVTPFSGAGSLDIDTAATFDVTQAGNTTTTSLVIDPEDFRADVQYFSPLPDRLPGSSEGSFFISGPFTTYGLTAYTADLATGFVEGLNFSLFYLGPSYDHGIPSDTYSFNLTITRQSAARNGDGSSGYAFTPTRLIQFLQDAQREGSAVQYQESYSTAESIGDYPYPVGTAGLGYTDNMARVLDVKLDGLSLTVSEPSAWLLSVMALAAAGAASRRRKFGLPFAIQRRYRI